MPLEIVVFLVIGLIIGAIIFIKKMIERREEKKMAAQAKIFREKKEREEEIEKQEKEKALELARKECAEKGHDWKKEDFSKDCFENKPDLFECLPLNCHVQYKCKRCGKKKEERVSGIADFNVPSGLQCNIMYNGKCAGQYYLKLEKSKCYCIRAIRDIPSMKIFKGEVFLVVNAINHNLFYSEKAIASGLASFDKDIAEKISMNDNMPGLAQFDKYVGFADDEGHPISVSKIKYELSVKKVNNEIVKEDFGFMDFGIIRVPKEGHLALFCVIKEESVLEPSDSFTLNKD